MFQRIPELEKSFAREAFQIAQVSYRAIKMMIGPGPLQGHQWEKRVREAVGPDMLLGVDANHNFSVCQANPPVRELEHPHVFWF
jgi:D-galactarolactone cycloisomerase